ncbi:MAG: hypothetical protein CSA22_03175 [Deltaproteobacteria bacterium]|nr:MAG: hypothetical protein CSA22_03175 [Deltaproteobacteria bacterium]
MVFNFSDLNGQTVGGVLITVTGGNGNDTGTLSLRGGVHSFVIGGQAFFIDTICPGSRVSGTVPNMLLLLD